LIEWNYLYLYAVDRYGVEQFSSMEQKISYIRDFEHNITRDLEAPFALLTLSIDDTHVNILTSEDLKSAIDKDSILDRHIVPLLASKDKNSLYAKVSAAMLNGYASIADEIAESRGIELKSSIGNSGAVASTIWESLHVLLVVVIRGLTFLLLPLLAGFKGVLKEGGFRIGRIRRKGY